MIIETSIVLILFALNPVINKYMLKFISVESLVLFSGVAYFWTALILIFLMNDKQIQTDFHTLNATHSKYLWLIIVALPLIHMVTHYYYFSLIRDYKTYLVTAIIAAYPLLTAVFGFILLNESFTYLDLLGILLIVVGVNTLKIRPT